MSNTTHTRLISGSITLLICALVVLWMLLSHLSVVSWEWPPKHGEIVMEEEFLDFDMMPATPDQGFDDPAMATTEEPVVEAQPAAESGTDLTDAGPAGKAPNMVTSTQESEIQTRKREEELAAAQRRREEEEIRREANQQISSAFDNAFGNHNAQSGTADTGNAGQKGQQTTQGSVSGTGSGSVGRGWALPQYARVPSPVTGSVQMTVTFDANGVVTGVTFTGGDAPAATDPAVRRACEAEVRAKKFVRTADTPGADVNRAQITYTFR